MELIPNVSQVTPSGEQTTVRWSKHKKRAGRKVNITEMHVKAAKNLIHGNYKRKGEALRAAGYSANSARIPGAIINNSPALQEAIRQELQRYVTPPADRANLIRGRLMQEVLHAKSSDAIRACEVAGKDREVRLFEPELAIGIFAVTGTDKLQKLLTTQDLPELPNTGSVRELSGECPATENSVHVVESKE